MPKVLIEAVIVGSSVALLAVYHLWLMKQLRNHPEKTHMGRQLLARKAWAKLDKEGRELVIVQGMRNLIMSASFLASTAILMAAGFLGGALTTDKLSQVTSTLNLFGLESESLWLLKVLILIVNFIVSFFNFSLAIRSFGYIGIMSQLPGDSETKTYDEIIAKEINRGANHYTLGMRGFYLSIPLILWLFGPVWMLLGTIVLIVVLRQVD